MGYLDTRESGEEPSCRSWRQVKRVAAIAGLASLVAYAGCRSMQRPAIPEATELESAAAPANEEQGTKDASGEPESEPGAGPRVAPNVARRFELYLEANQDLTLAGLKKKLQLEAPQDTPLSFDPTKARYYEAVADALRLNEKEKALFRERGIVGVDHAQHYSMGSAYYAIYTRDLPVLVTTDSILHALHRSYDSILKGLEVSLFSPLIEDALERTHAAAGEALTNTEDPALKTSLADVDLYLTVARNLTRGAASKGDMAQRLDDEWDGQLLVDSKAGQNDKALELLEAIASLTLQTPKDPTEIYGGRRPIDYSQFRPRGHYTESRGLARYFRTLMWLGRADLGWTLTPSTKASRLEADADRERRNAAVLSLLIEKSGARQQLSAMSGVIDFMVGRTDSVSVEMMVQALAAEKITALGQLSDRETLDRIQQRLVEHARQTQQIRSQVISSSFFGTEKTPAPGIFQMFGQRFLLDSFVLSKVVFDSIVYRGEKQKRWMPQGLDVMAALGNDEAVRLLEPDLSEHNYAANLLSARQVVDDHTEADWSSNLYQIWLSALRKLDDVPEESPHFPEVMRSSAWRAKTLQTQLASWGELRHDTLLYGKQSYTSYASCEYPAGYVEPYPEFFGTLATFAEDGSERLGEEALAIEVERRGRTYTVDAKRPARFLEHFAETMRTLEKLAKKELAARPFTASEQAFLKKVIDMRGMGSGPPRYTGWYPKLIYGGEPAKWKPTVADVHTDPRRGRVLEVGVGSANFLMVAVDNEDDRAVYVGPVSSYYEFHAPAGKRMTDPEWQSRLRRGKAPPRPTWVSRFQAPPERRHLARPSR